MTAPPGPIIGSGRMADVYDIGRGRVLRRNRDGSPTEMEARMMGHVRAHGYPAPEVYDSDGGDLVMERIEGPTILSAFPRRPWRGSSWARLLASLHDRLTRVPLPDFAAPQRIGPPEVVTHGDLHPDNVMLSQSGPVVIDWPNAGVGARGTDVAQTWVILASSTIDARGLEGAAQRMARSLFVRAFLRHADRDLARSVLSETANHRRRDRNVRAEEIARIDALLQREGLT